MKTAGEIHLATLGAQNKTHPCCLDVGTGSVDIHVTALGIGDPRRRREATSAKVEGADQRVLHLIFPPPGLVHHDDKYVAMCALDRVVIVVVIKYFSSRLKKHGTPVDSQLTGRSK